MLSTVLGYSADQLERLATILERVRPGTAVDREGLERRLRDLLEAVGRAGDGTDYTDAFRETGKLEPSHAELAKRFRAMAEAEDPLDPHLYSGTAAAELNAAARVRWSSRKRRKLLNRPHPLRGTSSEFLSEEELMDLRSMALHLAAFHQSFVQRKAPNKTEQDTLVEGLADIYLEFTGLDYGRYDLPHAPSTRFIQFVAGALCPFFGVTETSRTALSKRWKRLKDAANQARP